MIFLEILFSGGFFIYNLMWIIERVSTFNNYSIKAWISVRWNNCFLCGFFRYLCYCGRSCYVIVLLGKKLLCDCVIGEEVVMWLCFVSLVTFCGVLIRDPSYKLNDDGITSLMSMLRFWIGLLALSRLKISAGVVKLLLLWIFESLALFSVLTLSLWALEGVMFLLTISTGFLMCFELDSLRWTLFIALGKQYSLETLEIYTWTTFVQNVYVWHVSDIKNLVFYWLRRFVVRNSIKQVIKALDEIKENLVRCFLNKQMKFNVIKMRLKPR